MSSKARSSEPIVDAELQRRWLRWGYLLTGCVLLLRLAYIASDAIDLSEDEAYQWLWSRYPALSYFSKPPMIAYTQWLGTAIWGNTEFGIRFFSPVLGAMMAILLLRFFAREGRAGTGAVLTAAIYVTPMMAVGATLMVIDALSVCFWALSLMAGWRAMQSDRMGDWAACGLWLGFGFLSKYTAIFQPLCWILFFILWAPARVHLQRPGPYVALGIGCLFSIPVLVWNAQHDWITVTHLHARAGLDLVWRPTLRYFWDFIIAEFVLLNPIFVVGMIWACIGLWRRSRSALSVYFFSMGAPLFLGYLCYTVRARVHPNWIAPGIIPLFAVAVLYWSDIRFRNSAGLRRWLTAGFAIGLLVVSLLHETRIVTWVSGRSLPVELDPLRRVRGWRETAELVDKIRAETFNESLPSFLLGAHYGIASQMAFYLEESQSGLPDSPLVYCSRSEYPENQFYFFPGYDGRQGQNALHVRVCDSAEAPPPRIVEQFDSVSDLGVYDVTLEGRVLRRIQVIECRGLKEQ